MEFELSSFREINNRINLFFNNVKALDHPDIKISPNDEFTFLGGKFKFVRTLSLAKKIGMVDVFYWREEKRAYEMIEKFNLYFYADGPCQITNYLEDEQKIEKGALRKEDLSAISVSYFSHFYCMLVDREIAFNLSAKD
jgi:hypothetical protein